MFLDLNTLREFYKTPLGMAAREDISKKIHDIWPNMTNMRTLSLGYGTPYIDPWLVDSERLISLMPAAQGVEHWPKDQKNLSLLSYEDELPFSDSFFDRVILIHTVENTEHLHGMLRELWRILISKGRLLIIIPNRKGIWARFDHTPFGHGRPYTTKQMRDMLESSCFDFIDRKRALYFPPFTLHLMQKTIPVWNFIGKKILRSFSGAIIIEAEKQLYATAPMLRSRTQLRRRTAAARNILT
jgi:SAM-dependent methyltransferase